VLSATTVEHALRDDAFDFMTTIGNVVPITVVEAMLFFDFAARWLPPLGQSRGAPDRLRGQGLSGVQEWIGVEATVTVGRWG
jgi:hypothetical protein